MHGVRVLNTVRGWAPAVRSVCCQLIA